VGRRPADFDGVITDRTFEIRQYFHDVSALVSALHWSGRTIEAHGFGFTRRRGSECQAETMIVTGESQGIGADAREQTPAKATVDIGAFRRSERAQKWRSRA
jgi:hypothetical protein